MCNTTLLIHLTEISVCCLSALQVINSDTHVETENSVLRNVHACRHLLNSEANQLFSNCSFSVELSASIMGKQLCYQENKLLITCGFMLY